MSTIKLKVVRGDEESGKKLVEYDVPFVEGMSLLDALFWIRENEDSSLSVRYSCRSANACKECMATIEGKVEFLCSVRAVEGSTVTIEPLKTRPWIKDLTTIME